MQIIQASTQVKSDNHQTDPAIVLVVEDHPATRRVLSVVLGLHGYRAVCTANGQEALEWIEHALVTEQYPAVILLDLFMPIMDGATFLERFRACWPLSLPLPATILLTVDQCNHDELACTDILPKPFHIKDLLERLRWVLREEYDGDLSIQSA